jgi:hypothetical protein
MSAVGKALFIVVMPVVVFVGTGWPMMHFTERDQFRRTEAPESIPLNFRRGGYDAAEATAYWTWLGEPGRAAELRFLKVDLVFPLGYGAALLASLLIAWSALGLRFHRAWLALPVVIAVVADWVENAIHLRQLQAFMQGAAIDAGAIDLASRATTVKSYAFYAATLLILAFAAWLIVRRLAPRGIHHG